LRGLKRSVFSAGGRGWNRGFWCSIGSGYGGIAAVQVGTGGSLPPKIEINGGSQRGFWASGAYPPNGPDTIIVSILP